MTPKDGTSTAALPPPKTRARCAPIGLEEAVALGRMLRPAEQWRLFPELRDHARYLDIETLGLALEDPITLVGISDGAYTSVLVRGRDLCPLRLAEELAGARMLVTFNGISFDLPRLRRAFPGLPWDLPHLDLAVAGRAVGLRGGLKAIERRLGWRRPGGELDGAEAVRLWQAYLAGDRAALPRLVRYCRADVGTLHSLAEVVVSRLARESRDGAPGWLPPVEEGVCVLFPPPGARPA
ncbi:MAG: ribonuclease H-like domain-containing protein [Planctomycetota bacterium]